MTSAREFAIKAHGGQKYGKEPDAPPYHFHLDQVARLVTAALQGPPWSHWLSGWTYEQMAAALAVAYLHDVVEDTDTTVEEVKVAFGSEVAEAVALLTDEPGKNRKERKAKTYAKLAKASTNTAGLVARIVKTADRLANVHHSKLKDNTGLFKMYQKEHAAFRQAVYLSGLCDALHVTLDEALGVADESANEN